MQPPSPENIASVNHLRCILRTQHTHPIFTLAMNIVDLSIAGKGSLRAFGRTEGMPPILAPKGADSKADGRHLQTEVDRGCRIATAVVENTSAAC